MVDWNNRSFVEMETSTPTEDTHSAFGNPLIDSARRTSGNTEQPVQQPTLGPNQTFDSSNPNTYQNPQAYQGGYDASQTPSAQGPQGNNGGMWRSPYGSVAQPALDATNPQQQQYPQGYDSSNTPSAQGPQGNNGGLWRSPYGSVAPGAIEATNPNNQQQTPTDNGSGRPSYGVSGNYPGSGEVGQPGQQQSGGIDPATGQPLKPWAPSQTQLQTPSQVPGSNLGAPGGGPGGVSDQTRKNIAASLQENFSVFNQLAAGAVGGVLGSGPIPYGLDKLATHVPLARRVLEKAPLMNFKGHSPLEMQLNALKNQKTLYGVQQQQLQDSIDTHNQAITQATQERANIAQAAGQPELDYATGTARIDRLMTEAATKAGRTKNPTTADAWVKRANFLQEAKASGYTEAQGIDLTDPANLQALTLSKSAKAPTTDRVLFPEDAQVLQQMRLNQQIQESTAGIKQAQTGLDTIDRNIGIVDHSMQNMINTGESGFGIFGKGKGVTVEVGQTADGTPITKEIAAWKDPVTAESGLTRPLNRIAGKWNGEDWTSKVGEGMMVAGASMGTSMLLDHLVTGHPSKNLGTELPFMLGAMLMPNLSTKQRIAATIGGTAMGWAIDHFAPVGPDSSISKVMAPNWVDGVATSAAWMLPFDSIEGRIGAVALGYGLGRAADVANNFLGIHIPGLGNVNYAQGIYNDLNNTIRSGEGGMNNGHFQDIVSQGTKLGLENEGALEAAYSDFMNRHQSDQNPLVGLYGSAALSTAIGDTFYQRGTCITGDVNKDSKSNDWRILKDTGLDLAAPLPPNGLGDATTFYRGAASNLIQAENYAIQNHAPQGQIDDIKKSLGYVQGKLNDIYGKHDIQSAYDELKSAVAAHMADGSIEHYKVALKARVDAMSTSDPQYAAKMCRDLALVDLAIAGYQSDPQHNNGGDASLSYTEAQKYLHVAEQLQPSNPNNPQLDAIVRTLSSQIKTATTNQYNNGFNNPFGVQAPKS